MFDRIQTSFPAYTDPQSLREKAISKQKEIDFQTELDDLYHQALVNIDKNNLKKAKKLLQNIQRKEKGYQDTEKLLQRVDSLLESKKEARRLSFRIPDKWVKRFNVKTVSGMSRSEQILFFALAAISIASIIYSANIRVRSLLNLRGLDILTFFFRFDFGWVVYSILYIAILFKFKELGKSDRRRFYLISLISCILILLNYVFMIKYGGWQYFTGVNLYQFYRVDLPWLVV
ncbi:MAG: hypothetical protein GWN14_26275, partial [candidate division Zixibacteria bacterium]|nr:hypothetical protein [candidate division Zixibacteria bacterium]